MTLDALHHDLLAHLLRTDAIQWPDGHTTLEVLDAWRGQRGCRLLKPTDWRRAVTLNGTQVVQIGQRVGGPSPVRAIGNKADFAMHLSAGRCTHAEVRQILSAAYGNQQLKAAIIAYMACNFRAVIVDEVFDADQLDLAVIHLACEAAEMRVTVIGDPWQALYGFRGARPDLVPSLTEGKFVDASVTYSFRYEDISLRRMTEELRLGRPVGLVHGSPSEVDVVLASQWSDLWSVGENVLPLSFGHPDNFTDAVIALLLDVVVAAQFGEDSVFSHEALSILNIDPRQFKLVGSSLLRDALKILESDDPDSPATTLAALRQAAKALNCPYQLRRLRAESEQKQLARVSDLRRRLRAGSRLIPGVTVHQAKGREWDVVGVRLSESQKRQISSGLSQEQDSDRVLYVALTRARQRVVIV
jgi:DNA helicase-2/ATP-dependent DNA helicase PcrA